MTANAYLLYELFQFPLIPKLKAKRAVPDTRRASELSKLKLSNASSSGIVIVVQWRAIRNENLPMLEIVKTGNEKLGEARTEYGTFEHVPFDPLHVFERKYDLKAYDTFSLVFISLTIISSSL